MAFDSLAVIALARKGKANPMIPGPSIRASRALALLPFLVIACSDDPSGPGSDPGDDGAGGVPSEVVTWLQANARPFSTPEAGSGFEDLRFLKDMIGDASVVSLGEATHGTREFFQMKHRILEFLVEEMDFDLFAIEATWPEANRLNEYVHTGNGDPAVLLSGLYFWTWNTQEVLDMIQWMRAHNQNPGGAPTVSFLGFDMQFPGMAIDNVIEYLASVDPPASEGASARYACMLPFSNGPTGSRPSQARYRDETQGFRDDCLQDLRAVRDSLLAHQDEYEAASSAVEFSRADRSARVVLQFEDMESGRTPGARDVYMAENAIWLHDEAGPESRIVLWAHNGHVADNPTYGQGQSMGWHLRRHYQGDMVIVGFDFYQGGFRAVNQTSSGSYTGVEDHTVGPPPVGSYEYYFHSAGMERMILDLRNVDLGAAATTWLAGPRLMRSIGAVYRPTTPGDFLYGVSIPSRFDLIVYFENTSAAVGLPYNPPSEW
ncbi:MAG: erythromycin esterase family protein [Longimicrobiales bacterium]